MSHALVVMQDLYSQTRRMVAVFLIAALTLFAGFGFLGGTGKPAIVSTLAGLCAVIPLILVAVLRRRRLGLDTAAFLVAALAAGVCWGASTATVGYVTYLPALVAGICYAAIALTLRVDERTATRNHR